MVIISDTHGKPFGSGRTPAQQADVVIHCGDLTHHSKLDEFGRLYSCSGHSMPLSRSL